MRKNILFLLLIGTVAVQAQNIRGKVCFEKDKSPVQFASVALLQLPDSAIVTGVITLTDGGYLLEKISQGNYFVRASFVGYRNSGKAVTIGEGQGEIDADTIFLAETTAVLSEVTVVGERLKGKEMVDRTVYAIPEVVAKTSNNGYDILKRIPQVNVDFQNNITLNGSNNCDVRRLCARYPRFLRTVRCSCRHRAGHIYAPYGYLKDSEQAKEN